MHIIPLRISPSTEDFVLGILMSLTMHSEWRCHVMLYSEPPVVQHFHLIRCSCLYLQANAFKQSRTKLKVLLCLTFAFVLFLPTFKVFSSALLMIIDIEDTLLQIHSILRLFFPLYLCCCNSDLKMPDSEVNVKLTKNKNR